MSLPRLRLERCSCNNGIWTIDAEEAHHLVRVRHCYTGSLVEGLLDGERVTLRLHCDGALVTARELSREAEPAFEPRMELLLGLLKNDQLDEALRFCAETGVARIRLAVCERSVPRYDGPRIAEKMKRWRKILDEATKQAGAATPPELCEPVPFERIDFSAMPEQRLAAMLADDAVPLREVHIERSLALAIGPEGDWAPEEGARLLDEGFKPVSLGARILRASTAVAAFCSAAALMFKK